MDKEVRRLKKIHLALAVAEGESIIAWAQENAVPERTAFPWAQDPRVGREVDACRRRALNMTEIEEQLSERNRSAIKPR